MNIYILVYINNHSSYSISTGLVLTFNSLILFFIDLFNFYTYYSYGLFYYTLGYLILLTLFLP